METASKLSRDHPRFPIRVPPRGLAGGGFLLPGWREFAASSEHPCVRFTRDGATYTAENGNIIYYRQSNGIYYHTNKPASAINALEQARARAAERFVVKMTS